VRSVRTPPPPPPTARQRTPHALLAPALQGFTATLQQREPSDAQMAAWLAAPWPPFDVLLVEDLVPPELLDAYHASCLG
jgi:hypothetical protein